MTAADAPESHVLVPQVGLADADDVARGQPARAVEPRAVEERAVRRAEVLDPDAVLPRLEARVPRRRVLVGRDRDVVLVAAADRQLRGVELEVLALVEVRALDDDEPAGVRARPRRRARRRPAAGARMKLSCGRRRSRLAVRTIRQMKR